MTQSDDQVDDGNTKEISAELDVPVSRDAGDRCKAGPLLSSEDAQMRAELTRLLREALAAAGTHTLLAITMLCMLPGNEESATELLPPLFREFKGKVRYACMHGVSRQLHSYVIRVYACAILHGMSIIIFTRRDTSHHIIFARHTNILLCHVHHMPAAAAFRTTGILHAIFAV